MKINLDKSQIVALFVISIFSILMLTLFFDNSGKILYFTYYYLLIGLSIFLIKWNKIDVIVLFMLFVISVLMILGLSFISYNFLAFSGIYSITGVALFVCFHKQIDLKLTKK